MNAVLSSSAVVVAKAVVAAPAVAVVVVVAWAARACCSIRCCVRSSSCICGGRAARNSGFISTLFEVAFDAAAGVSTEAAAVDGVSVGFAVAEAASDVAVTAAGVAVAGTGRFRMSIPFNI